MLEMGMQFENQNLFESKDLVQPKYHIRFLLDILSQFAGIKLVGNYK